MPTRGQPVAEGTYVTTRNGEVARRETWQLAKMAHKGLVFSSRAEQFKPQGTHWNFSYTITQHWEPVSLSIHLEGNDSTIASEQRFQGKEYQVRIEPRGGEPKESRLDLDNAHELAFPSPVFTAVTLFHLGLQVGQSREVQSVAVSLPSLEARSEKFKYTCVAEEQVQIPAGAFAAWHYTVEGNDGDGQIHFWADRTGTILKQKHSDGAETELTRYRRIERR